MLLRWIICYYRLKENLQSSTAIKGVTVADTLRYDKEYCHCVGVKERERRRENY